VYLYFIPFSWGYIQNPIKKVRGEEGIRGEIGKWGKTKF
jgi:hypothetical protein